MPLLPHAQVLRLHAAIVSAGRIGGRDTLLGGLDPAFIESLPLDPDASAQLLRDLTELNRVERLADGTVPLKLWLENAAQLAGPRLEADVFRETLALLDARSTRWKFGWKARVLAVIALLVAVAGASRLWPHTSPATDPTRPAMASASAAAALASSVAMVAPTTVPNAGTEATLPGAPPPSSATAAISHQAAPAATPPPVAPPGDPLPADTTVVRTGDLAAGNESKIRVGDREGSGSVKVETKKVTVGNDSHVGVGNMTQTREGDAGASVGVKTGDVHAGDRATIEIGTVKK